MAMAIKGPLQWASEARHSAHQMLLRDSLPAAAAFAHDSTSIANLHTPHVGSKVSNVNIKTHRASSFQKRKQGGDEIICLWQQRRERRLRGEKELTWKGSVIYHKKPHLMLSNIRVCLKK